MTSEPQIVSQLQDLLSKIRAFPDPRRASNEWKQAFNLLKKTGVESNHLANVIARRDVEDLSQLISELGSTDAPAAADANAPDDATCKAAMRAFAKRLKLTKLDAESQINSRNPLTSGASSSIDSIIPPKDFPPEVWAELARRGELRHTGQGFYALA